LDPSLQIDWEEQLKKDTDHGRFVEGEAKQKYNEIWKKDPSEWPNQPSPATLKFLEDRDHYAKLAAEAAKHHHHDGTSSPGRHFAKRRLGNKLTFVFADHHH